MKTQRNLLVAAGVLLLHVGGVWALQAGLVRRAVESVVPETIMAVLIEPEPPQELTPPKAVESPPPPPVVHKVARRAPPPPAPAPRPLPKPRPAPQPVAQPTPAPAPAPEAPVVTPTEVALAPIPQPAVQAAPPAPPAPPAPVVVAKAAPAAPTPVELPVSDADYLQNPRPAYPPISRKLREQGKVVIDVLIGADGSAQQAKVSSSSGFDRLDAAALATVQRWRYVPGRKGGVATAMWFSVPINFVLE
ncbi:MAG TPA: energy transducer TonB [Ramlibacter sp.]|uniref:energy transducer TonB n=1 Tax=Ramlibacter sp. TaxID=1917967 RepID=UPI002D80439B|nr:energy transducer TonB [Ramlibacter sp.]HET8744397.1 energy transducer TonB [Ramlibacter sp.]